VEVGERGDGDGGAGGDEREVGREHLALQVPELVSGQVPARKKIQNFTTAHHGVSPIDRSISQFSDTVIRFPKIQHGSWIGARTGEKRSGVFGGGRG
jgi:hypothetical protein